MTTQIQEIKQYFITNLKNIDSLEALKELESDLL